ERVDHVHRELRPLLDQRGPPRLHAVVVHGIRFSPKAYGLRDDRGDDALRRALDQLPDERPTDAVADHHEAPDTQVIHEGEVIVGIGVPGPIDLARPGGLAARRVAQGAGAARALARDIPGRRGWRP